MQVNDIILLSGAQFLLSSGCILHIIRPKFSYARVLEVEKGCFTPLVFSTSGGMGGEAERLVKKLASNK